MSFTRARFFGFGPLFLVFAGLFLFCLGAMAPAWAGFNFQSSVPFAAKKSRPALPESDPNAPALEVFEDRYVPDTIKKKYGLSDDWYGMSSPTPLTREEILLSAPTNPDRARDRDDMATDDKTVVVPLAPVFVETWRARKGEPVRDVLRRWSLRQKTDLLWASTSSPLLQKDFSYVGKFQEAVNRMIAESGGDSLHTQYRSEGLTPVMMSPASTITSSTAAVPVPKVEKAGPGEPKGQEESADPGLLLPLPLAVAPAAGTQGGNEETRAYNTHIPATKGKPETRWFGMAGASLSEVLEVWADDAGVQLLWQCEKPFALQETVSQVGLFEDAVFAALTQFDGKPVRPVGEMYKNPQTGRNALVVRTDSAF